MGACMCESVRIAQVCYCVMLSDSLCIWERVQNVALKELAAPFHSLNTSIFFIFFTTHFCSQGAKSYKEI